MQPTALSEAAPLKARSRRCHRGYLSRACNWRTRVRRVFLQLSVL